MEYFPITLGTTLTKPTTLTLRHITSKALVDPIFTEEFRQLLAEAGCEPHRIAPRCPWENGYAERFVRSLKESVLRKCLFTSESALRLALAEFQTYFNHERPHQGIDNRTVLGSGEVPTATGKVVRIPRVGGLINHYERVA